MILAVLFDKIIAFRLPIQNIILIDWKIITKFPNIKYVIKFKLPDDIIK